MCASVLIAIASTSKHHLKFAAESIAASIVEDPNACVVEMEYAIKAVSRANQQLSCHNVDPHTATAAVNAAMNDLTQVVQKTASKLDSVISALQTIHNWDSPTPNIRRAIHTLVSIRLSIQVN
jgi:hypothetical protein